MTRRMTYSLRSKAAESGNARRAAHEELPDDGLPRAGQPADLRVVDGHVAPAEEALALGLDGLADDGLALGALAQVLRQEDHADAVLALLGQRDAQRVGVLPEEGVRDLELDAGAVAGVRVAALGAAVLQVDEHLDALLDDRVGAGAADVGDHADAAAVVLMGGGVQPALGGVPLRGLQLPEVGAPAAAYVLAPCHEAPFRKRRYRRLSLG